MAARTGVANLSRRQDRRADDPGEQLVVGHLHQRLEIGEIAVAELAYMGIGEAPEKQVHLARAPVPGAEERPPPARIEAVPDCRSCVARRK